MDAAHNGRPVIDPLRRVYVPIENPQGFFRTSDGERYRRTSDGVIRRLKKVNGKVARRLRLEARKRKAGGQ